jgi:hypothetical protein
MHPVFEFGFSEKNYKGAHSSNLRRASICHLNKCASNVRSNIGVPVLEITPIKNVSIGTGLQGCLTQVTNRSHVRFVAETI